MLRGNAGHEGKPPPDRGCFVTRSAFRHGSRHIVCAVSRSRSLKIANPSRGRVRLPRREAPQWEMPSERQFADDNSLLDPTDSAVYMDPPDEHEHGHAAEALDYQADEFGNTAEDQLERQASGSMASSSAPSRSSRQASEAGSNKGTAGSGQRSNTMQRQELYTWLFSNKAASIMDLSTRQMYGKLLSSAVPLLQQYDIQSAHGRAPNLRKNTQLIEPCLTARAAALEAARRRPRLEAPEEEEFQKRLTVILERPQDAPLQPVEDEQWQQKQQSQQSFLAYMQQLQQQMVTQQRLQARVLQQLPQSSSAGALAKQQQDELDQQLMYQIGITDHWLQCRHLLHVFGASVGPAPVAALFKRLTDTLAAPRDRAAMSPSEGIEFQSYCRELAARALPVVCSMTPQQVGRVAYGLACLEMADSTALLEALVDRSAALFAAQLANIKERRSSRMAAQAQGNSSRGSSSREGSSSSSSSSMHASMQPQRSAVGIGMDGGGASQLDESSFFVAADYASLVWSLGTLGHRPPDAWLEAFCSCCLPRLDVFQPSQLWGVLWGLAKLGYLPQQVWMDRALMCAERVMQEFSAEDLCHLIWALGAVGYVPEKTWLRSFIGQVRAKYRSLLPPQMTELMEGLAAVGYKPREEVCWSLQAQARKYLHAFTPAQQSTLIRAMAMHRKWQPQRQFLYDFVTHSKPKLASMTAFQLSGILWAFARFKYLPDKSYLRPLLANLYDRMEATAQPSGPSLSQCLWAMAELKLKPPGTKWLEMWSLKARQATAGFTPQCLAHTLWALPRLSAGPPEAELVEGLLLRVSQELPSLSCMELSMIISSLAALQYRPSEVWLAAFVEHAGERLPDFQNQDYGLVLWALGSLATPVDDLWLQAFIREAGRKWWSMDLEGMALLMWGLAQYGQRPDKRDWWEGFWKDSDLRWQGASTRTLAMLTLALADLVTTAPARNWQRNLMRAIRLTFPKPATSAGIPLMLKEAAGLQPGDPLPKTLWFRAFLAELRVQWGFVHALEER